MLSIVLTQFLPALGIPLLVILAMGGWGNAFLRTASVRGSLSTLEYAATSLSLGMAAYSLVIILLALAGWYDFRLVIVMHAIGIALLIPSALRTRMPSVPRPDLVILAVPLVALSALMLMSTFYSAAIHPDARQYELAFPWLTSFSGGIVRDSNLLNAGTYLGYDVLLLTLGDLSHLLNNPAMLDRLKLFNALTELLLPISVYLLSRSFGASKAGCIVAATATFTIGQIVYWGLLKNDLFSGGIGILALTILMRAYEKRLEILLGIATALAAYAVSAKITNVVPVGLPFLFVYLSGRFTMRAIWFSSFVGLLLVAPWLFYAYVIQGNPLHPLAQPMPPEMKAAWLLRNANGIDRTAENFVKMFPAVALGSYKISGNQTIGILTFVALPVVAACVINDGVKRKFSLPQVIALSALIWFALFYYMRFDNRFLSRYIVLCSGVFFAFCVFRFEDLPKRFRGTLAACSVGVISVLALLNSPIQSRLQSVSQSLTSSLLLAQKHDEIVEFSAPFRVIKQRRKEGEAVAINDGIVLFLDPPFVNVSGLHAVDLNVYTRDVDDLQEYLADRSVGLILFRPGIAGITEALTGYLAKCATMIQEFPGLELHEVRPECRLQRASTLRGMRSLQRTRQPALQ